jgi:hypothetical protein
VVYIKARGIIVGATMQWPLRPRVALGVDDRDEEGKPMGLIIIN